MNMGVLPLSVRMTYPKEPGLFRPISDKGIHACSDESSEGTRLFFTNS